MPLENESDFTFPETQSYLCFFSFLMGLYMQGTERGYIYNVFNSIFDLDNWDLNIWAFAY